MSRRGTRFVHVLLGRRSALVGLVLILLLTLASLLLPVLHGGDPLSGTDAAVFQGPSLAHPFGTDGLGRDLMLRVFYGGRFSLLIGFTSVLFSILIGLPLGAVAGYLGGWPDTALMRFVDFMLSFPSLLLAIVLTTVFGGASLHSLILSVGIVGIPQFARQMRAEVLSLKEREFVLAARSLGFSHFRILFRHLLPNAVGPITVLATLRVGTAILDAAGLSFLGLGVEVGVPEWGTMIKIGRDEMSRSIWTALFPGLALTGSVLGFNLFGDGLRDALDPKLKGVRS